MLKKSLRLVFFFSGFLSCGSLLSQINAGADQFTCPPNCATLTATVNPATGGTSSYAISNIPYAPDPFNAGTSLVWQSNGDDEVHGPYNIGFDFCFMGFTRTQFWIGINGWVGFSNGPTNYTSSTIPSTAASVPKDCIMGPWQDWYPGYNNIGQVRYQLYGTAPFRRMVVSWNNSPLFSCTALTGTFQIVMYETSNIVETHIQSKPGPCSWAGGTAVHGLHNLFGTQAFVVPGRNSTQWVTVNEGYRFTPNGAPDYTVQWYQGANPVGVGATVVTCPTTTTTYTAQITYNCTGATFTDQMVVNVGSANAQAGPDVSICTNGSTQLNASGGILYSWSPGTGLSCTTCPNPVASPTTTTSYTVTVTDANGCTGTDVITVTVSPPPNAQAGPDVSICANGSTQLNASGGTTYSWLPVTGLSCTTCSNPTASPTVTTSYTVTVSNGGCTATDVVVVSVNPAPSATSSAAPATICSGSNSQLTAGGGVSYNWTPSISLNNGTISNPVATPTSTTTYTVTVTDANGCTATSTITVTVTTASATASTANNSICPGNNTQLSSTGGGTYSWSPSTSLSNSTIFNPVATPTTTTTYTVIVTDLNGCTASATVTVTVTAPPAVTASASPGSFCLGGSSQLTGGGGVSYSWAPSSSLSSSTISNPVATPTTTTTYTATITDANGCVGTATVTVVVNVANVSAQANNPSICVGDNTPLTAAGNGVSFSWSPGGSLSNTTSSNPTATPTTTTTYTVVATDANGCTASATVTITVNPLPNATATAANSTICPGGNTTLTGSGGVTYSWSPSGSLSNPISATPVATPSSTTTYTVTVTNANGCTATATVTITVAPAYTLGTSSTTDETCGSLDGTATAGTPSGGQAPFTYLWSNGQTGATATGLISGSYTVTVTDANGCTSTQVVNVNQVIGANANASANPPTGTSPLPVNFVNTSTGATNYFWDFGDGSPTSNAQNPPHTYANPGTYTVTLIVWNNNQACADTIYLTVVVEDVVWMIMPNVFTPNNDNYNELLVCTTNGLVSAEVMIFNRWGNVVKKWNPMAGAWDGKDNSGQEVSQGTYYYTLNGITFDQQSYSRMGWIQVMK